MAERNGRVPDGGAEMAPVVDRNIEAMLARRAREERTKRLQERVVDRIAGFAGSLPFVYVHVVAIAAWIAVNLGWTPIRPFDPSLVVLAMIASVEAIFLTAFVLITQNRMARLADERADLDLQISLLAEHEITAVLQLVRAMAARMGVDHAHDPRLEPLQRDVRPEAVLEKLSEGEARLREAVEEPQRDA